MESNKMVSLVILSVNKRPKEFITNLLLNQPKNQDLQCLIYLSPAAVNELRQKLSSLGLDLKQVSTVTEKAKDVVWSTVSLEVLTKTTTYLVEHLKQLLQDEDVEKDKKSKKSKVNLVECVQMQLIARPDQLPVLGDFVKSLPQFDAVCKNAAMQYFDEVVVWEVVSEVPVKLMKFGLVELLAARLQEDPIKKLVDVGCSLGVDKILMRGDAEVLQMLMRLTNNKCLLHTHPFHRLAYAAKIFPERLEKFLATFEMIVQHLPAGNAKHLLSAISPKHDHMTALQYACKIQSSQFFQSFLNLEGVHVTVDDAINYDVTNLIPDTMTSALVLDEFYAEALLNDDKEVLLSESGKLGNDTDDDARYSKREVQLSCLEIIVASSATSQSEAAKLLNTLPIAFLVQDYTFIAKMINVFMFLFHVLHITTFTAFNLRSEKMQEIDTSLGCQIMDDKDNSTKNEDITYNKALPIIWVIWPLVAFVYSFIQFSTFRSILKMSKFNASCMSAVSSFPYIDFAQLLLTLAWAIINSFLICTNGYLRLLSTLLILSWLRPLKYLAFGKHWNAFVVALKSSVLKYIVSFVFVFVFIFLGFSFAIRVVMIERDTQEDARALEDIVYVSFISVFGMGDLSEFPTPDNSNIVFLRIIISVYCAVSAILILAMLRQPDDDLVARVGLLRSQRVKLELNKEILWYVGVKRRLRRSNWRSDNLFCAWLFVKKILGFYDYAKELRGGRFYARVCKETVERWKVERISE